MTPELPAPGPPPHQGRLVALRLVGLESDDAAPRDGLGEAGRRLLVIPQSDHPGADVGHHPQEVGAWIPETSVVHGVVLRDPPQAFLLPLVRPLALDAEDVGIPRHDHEELVAETGGLTEEGIVARVEVVEGAAAHDPPPRLH